MVYVLAFDDLISSRHQSFSNEVLFESPPTYTKHRVTLCYTAGVTHAQKIQTDRAPCVFTSKLENKIEHNYLLLSFTDLIPACLATCNQIIP